MCYLLGSNHSLWKEQRYSLARNKQSTTVWSVSKSPGKAYCFNIFRQWKSKEVVQLFPGVGNW